MCGIAGALGRDLDSTLGRQVVQATRALAHRGPDGEGFWSAGAEGSGPRSEAQMDAPAWLALGHRRLSIVDLEGGAQPMANEDGRVWVTFNGEIYNHAELRAELERAGHHFRTRSDTEVLVHGWEAWGESLFGRLNGIFAVAIADLRSREVILARDPVGVKPLFVGTDGAQTWWSSELTPPCVARAGAVSPDALKLFLTFRFIPSPWSAFERAWKVPPSHLLRLRPDEAGAAPRFRAYASTVRSSAQPASRDEWRAALLEELEGAVERQLMSDVPVASLLSGGIDSSIVTQAMAARLSYRPRTYGIGFRSHGALNEAHAAALAARELAVPHESVSVRDDDYVADWPRAVRQIGEPIANSGGLLVRRLCEAAAASHKVVLTGQGADEPLGGYPRHMAERLYQLGRRAPRLSRAAVRLLVSEASGERLGRVLAEPSRADRYLEIFAVVPCREVDGLVGGGSAPARELARAAVARWADSGDDADPLNALLRVDTRLSLADDLLIVADHFSMRASVELRVPFLDLRFLELAERMPSRYKLSRLGERKWLYREGAARRLPRPMARRLCGLRARVGRKQGFTTPLAAWFTSPEGPLASAERWTPALRALAGIEQHGLDRLLARPARGDAARQRMTLYSLAVWAEGLA